MTQRAMSMGGYPIEVLTPQDGSGTAITTAQITDATKTGKQLLTAKDAAAARQAIGAKADNYRPKVADISDASAIGRQILAAKDADAIKALLGL
ncbi:hypothetical protein [Candidatus Sodalis pierantonius]|uniref:hypothetical protein n=1 Tax=Candidatus Sodalis pierantonii TaxID=1486991 RepID=UPI00046C9D3C|nr:hypothetical protein [Candidatus Sodalis pierantonius]